MARGKVKRSRERSSKKFSKHKKSNYGRIQKSKPYSNIKQTRGSDPSLAGGSRSTLRRNLTNETKNNRNLISSSDDGSENEDYFKQLLSGFSVRTRSSQMKAVESDTSSEEEVENENMLTREESSSADDEDEDDVLEVDSRTPNEEDDDIPPDVSIINERDEMEDPLDPFVVHFHYDIDDSLAETLSKVPCASEKFNQHWPVLGDFTVHLPHVIKSKQSQELTKVTIENEKQFAKYGTVPSRITSKSAQLHIKPQIQNNISQANIKNLNAAQCEGVSFTPLQMELFSVINNYQDIYYPERTLKNGEEIRFIYCLHAINHILKTRTKVLHHNQKLLQKDYVPEEYRDQGLVRPKVVILVPFRESALRVMKMIMDILVPDEKSNIMNKKRFFDEFTGNEIAMPKKNPRPEDYEETFAGNTDDTFRIGISVTKRSLRLYADFYSADIIIASPLGLRVIVGADGEEGRDFDFLSSIEILILDQAEIFLMQNWDHLLHVLDHFHIQPKEAHGTNFARVRSWALNGWTRYYRQSLLFSSVRLPEFSALINKKFHNYSGKVCVMNPVLSGSICQVIVQLPQVFHRFEAHSVAEAIDARFEFFLKKILSQYKDAVMNHVLIYVPSYFDFVRLRNHFKKEGLNFVQICEYSKDGKVARARDMFYHDEAHVLLYSERFHFFRRPTIKGILHILFYQPPTFPHFYSEMCNFMQEINLPKVCGNESNMTVTVLYSKYDVQRLAAIVGTERAARMINSDRTVHMFMTGE